MTWYEELQAWLERERSLERVEEALIEAGLSHALPWSEVHQFLARRPDEHPELDDVDYGRLYREWVMACLREAFTPAQQESLIRPLCRGARPEELLVLKVHGMNCEGEDLAVIDGRELRRRQEAVALIHQSDGGSKWLEGYTRLLLQEYKRRLR